MSAYSASCLFYVTLLKIVSKKFNLFQEKRFSTTDERHFRPLEIIIPLYEKRRCTALVSGETLKMP